MDSVINIKMSFSDEAAIYDKTTQYLLLDYNQTLSQVVKHIGLRKNSSIKILDVGCGTGNLAKQIRQEYPRAQIYALDFSEDMIKVAIEKNIPQVHFITADLYDVEELDLPYFDIIIATFVFHNFRDVREHSRAMTALNKLLSVNGKLIIADLIDPEDTEKKDRNREKLMLLMREHHLMEEEIYSWIGKLNIEDKPLTIQKTINCLHEAGFIGVQTFISNESYSAIFVGKKDADIIQIKAELICAGVRPNARTKELYLSQNPRKVPKTGNYGIFLTLNGLDALVGTDHSANRSSPFTLNRINGKYILRKFGEPVNVDIEPVTMPEWAFSTIDSNTKGDNFSNYFLYEGHGFLHLAYKSCSFSEDQKCKFCSVKRRAEHKDNDVEAICHALETTLPSIPDDVHFCLGGGTYLPLEENVEFFKKIIMTIRNNGRKNPIWIEMVPPSIPCIQELIDAGATSFGFNIEIWDQEFREKLCPGKSTVSRDYYLQACKYVVDTLGSDTVGTCLIVGLDAKDSIMNAIDNLLQIGIQPCLLIYKDYDTKLGGYYLPKSYQRDYIFLSEYATRKANSTGMLFKNNQGCLKCNCCTIMHDIQNKYVKELDYENRSS